MTTFKKAFSFSLKKKKYKHRNTMWSDTRELSNTNSSQIL